MLWRLIVIFLLLPSAGWGEVCESGFAPFKEYVYPKIRKDCAKCHDGTNDKAPPFALDEAELSYERVLSYLNFNDLDKSLFVVRAGNGHCDEESCEFESGEEMLQLAQSWWSAGEKKCFRNGRFFSNDVTLPKTLPVQGEGFAKIRFDLGVINEKFAGLLFQIEVQDFFPKSAENNGAILVKSPRLLNGKKPIHLKDIKILLNGKYDRIYNSFTTIDKPVSFFNTLGGDSFSATPILSSQSLLILRDSLTRSKLSVSFVEIQEGEGRGCYRPENFTKLKSLLESSSCTQCHSGTGETTGALVTDFSSAKGLSCQVATELVDFQLPALSPLLSFPIKERFGHPKAEKEFGMDFVKSVKFWLGESL